MNASLDPTSADGAEGVVLLARAGVATAAVAVAMNRSGARPSNESKAEDADIDRELVLCAQKGDMAAFRQLVTRHERRAFAVAMAMVRNENDARELVQDAFLRAYKGLAGFQGDSSFYTWFYRIVKNLAVDQLRRPGRATVEIAEDHAAGDEGSGGGLGFASIDAHGDPQHSLRRKEMSATLHAAFALLSREHREVVVMREVEGASYEEMAEVLGISKGTVMSRLFYARQKLQTALAEFYRTELADGPRAASGTGGE